MSDTFSVDTNFVVYAYIREDGTPYYIGKGRPERPYKGKGRPCKRPSEENRIVILHENIDEQTAFRIEKELIAKYKRKDLYLEEGLLYNKSNGGEGSSGTIVCLKLMVRSFHIRSGYFWRIKIKQLNNLKKKKKARSMAGGLYLLEKITSRFINRIQEHCTCSCSTCLT